MKKQVYISVFIVLCVANPLIAITQTKKIDSLQKVLRTRKEDTNKVNTLNKLSFEYQAINDYKTALQIANESLLLAIKINYKAGQANAYMSLGASHEEQFDFNQSRKDYYSAIKIKEEIGDVNLGKGYTAVAYTYHLEDNFSEALKISLYALKIYEKSGDKLSIGNGYFQIGASYHDFGNIKESEKYFSLALKTFEEIGNKENVALALVYKSMVDIELVMIHCSL